MGAISLYAFEPITAEVPVVRDLAGIEEPLDLRIGSPEDGYRIRDAEIAFSGPSMGRTARPASRVTRALQRTGEISVEVICASDGKDQTGPARIVSMSADTKNRNFTLGQEGTDLVFRIRLPGMGSNGIGREEPRWPGVFGDTNFRHIVVAYANRQLKVFVDGTAQQPKTFVYSSGSYVGAGRLFTDSAFGLLSLLSVAALWTGLRRSG
jgi:hypothetical protein